MKTVDPTIARRYLSPVTSWDTPQRRIALRNRSAWSCVSTLAPIIGSEQTTSATVITVGVVVRVDDVAVVVDGLVVS